MPVGESPNPFEERHYTIPELAEMWKFSREFVRQIVSGEPGVTEWVRQQPGRRRYRVIRVPQSVVERLYRRALTRAEQEGFDSARAGRSGDQSTAGVARGLRRSRWEGDGAATRNRPGHPRRARDPGLRDE